MLEYISHYSYKKGIEDLYQKSVTDNIWKMDTAFLPLPGYGFEKHSLKFNHQKFIKVHIHI